MTRRSYKFLMRPTSKQVAALQACLEDHRQLYNAALEERREAWRMRRVPIGFYAQSAQLREIRAADPEGHGRWSATAQRMTLRRLDQAFTAFFNRIKAGQKPGYPRSGQHLAGRAGPSGGIRCCLRSRFSKERGVTPSAR